MNSINKSDDGKEYFLDACLQRAGGWCEPAAWPKGKSSRKRRAEAKLSPDGCSPLVETRMLVRCRVLSGCKAWGKMGGIAELAPSLLGTGLFCFRKKKG